MTGARIVERQCVYSGWSRLERISLRMPDGAVVERHIEHHGSAAVVLPYDPARRCAMLVSMPRPPVLDAGEPDLLEAIAGALGEGETAEECARREALEEAGLSLGTLEPLGTFWSIPSVSTERITLFLAAYGEEDLKGPGGGAPGEHENVTSKEVPLEMLRAAAGRGALGDLKTMLLLQALGLRRPALFSG